jgi:hypothetical protein
VLPCRQRDTLGRHDLAKEEARRPKADHLVNDSFPHRQLLPAVRDQFVEAAVGAECGRGLGEETVCVVVLMVVGIYV